MMIFIISLFLISTREEVEQNKTQNITQSYPQSQNFLELQQEPRFKEKEKLLQAKKPLDLDIKSMDMYLSELSKITSHQHLIDSIAHWNSLSDQEQQSFIKNTKTPNFVPVPILTYYQIPIIHHIPVNQILRTIHPVPLQIRKQEIYKNIVPRQVKQQQLILDPKTIPYKSIVPIPYYKISQAASDLDDYKVLQSKYIKDKEADDDKKKDDEKKDDDTKKDEDDLDKYKVRFHNLGDLNDKQVVAHRYEGETEKDSSSQNNS